MSYSLFFPHFLFSDALSLLYDEVCVDNTRDYVGMEYFADDTREDAGIGNIKSESNAQAQSFDNSISLYRPFTQA